jgi:3-deoxy-manno-octulosonate cytidylyltransferase (CMP-KDO synthetase)
MTRPGFKVVIPARFASVRLPGKPLADIHGKPMIVWVYEAARRSRATDVIVATDDERIAAACRAAGVRVELTAANHASGTDRIAELATRFTWPDDDIVVNVQGDEPLLPPRLVDQVAGLLEGEPVAGMATLVTPVRDERELHDPNVVKVVGDAAGGALYFSRAPIPYPHDDGLPPGARRHIGIYAYRVRSLKVIAGARPCAPETAERLEQLRALWLGIRILIADAVEVPPRAVDSGEDLAEVRRLAKPQ